MIIVDFHTQLHDFFKVKFYKLITNKTIKNRYIYINNLNSKKSWKSLLIWKD